MGILSVLCLISENSCRLARFQQLVALTSKGPPRLPIFGAYGFMLLLNYKHLYRAVAWLCKYYKTDVLGLYVGPYLAMVTHSYEATKECMNNINFDGKPLLPLAALREPNFQPYGEH